MEIDEYTIPVPWGHIAVKAWGNKIDLPVLVAHGMQDNAGIFDRIMPLLPQCFYYVCIDFPSHGRSSPFPSQMFLSPIDGVIICKMILDYLDRKKYILLGHSWGADAFAMFTQIYPEYVLKLCLIDGFYRFPLSADTYRSYWQSRINGLLRINENIAKKAQPHYTYEEAMDRLITNRIFGGMTQATAECLLKRCLIPIADGKFVFTTDPRPKVFLVSNSDIEYMVAIAKNCPIECPMLLVRAKLTKDAWSKFQPLLEELEKNPICKIQQLDGNHDDFSNRPELWAATISEFLCTEYYKL